MKRILTVIALLFATPMLVACGPIYPFNQKHIIDRTPQEILGRAHYWCRAAKRGSGIEFIQNFALHPQRGVATSYPRFSSLSECKSVALKLFYFDLYKPIPNFPYERQTIDQIADPSVRELYQAGEQWVANKREENLTRRCLEEGAGENTEFMRTCKFTMKQNDYASQSAAYSSRAAAERAEKAVKDAEFNKKIQSIFDNNN
jgi:hypothetical protein